MNTAAYLKPELGKVSRYLDVSELIIRTVPSYDLPSELDGVSHDEMHETELDRESDNEILLQGRLVNLTKHKLCEVKYDLSHFDKSGMFLGLDKSLFLEEDELDIDDHLPIDMVVELPEGTSRCVFNVRAKKPGLISRLFWG